MSERPPLSDEDRATLVAYLDGELDEDAVRQVEARISQDPTVRAEVESMKRTWELLDYLPRAEPSPTFTHRTVSLVTGEHRAAPAGAAAAAALAARGRVGGGRRSLAGARRLRRHHLPGAARADRRGADPRPAPP